MVQGWAEFLPISSSGHLVLAQRLLHLEPPGLVLEVALHVATVVAVLVYYRSRLWKTFRGSPGGRGGWGRFLGLLVVASLPAAVVGLIWEDQVEALFDSPRATAYALFFTAAVLAVAACVRRGRKGLADMGWGDAVAVGVAQAVAIAPGVSRSGMTITAALIMGMAGEDAAAFSFLLSVPAILGAAVLELRHVAALQGYGVGVVVAAAVAFVSGLLAIKVVNVTVRGRRFLSFAFYCAAAATVSLLVIKP